MGPARLRARRQPRGHAPHGRPRAQAAADGLRRGRPRLRHRGAAAGGTHQRRRPERGLYRQPGRHHRGGARRHEPVRRPRHDHRHADRRPDHRRGAQRPRPDGRRRRRTRSSSPASWSSSPCPSTRSRGSAYEPRDRSQRHADPVGARAAQALRQRHGHRRRRLRPLSRRDPRRDRGQRRRQVEHDQGALGRHHPGRGRDPPRRRGGALQVAARRTLGGHRDRLSGPRRGPRARHRDQPVPRSREAARRHPRERLPDARPQGPEGGGRQADEEPADRHPLDEPGGGDALGRPAPGRRRGARGGVGAQARDHGRADGRARRQGVRPGARADQARARQRACP